MRTFALPSDEWRNEHGGLDRVRFYWFERVSYKTRLLRLPLVRRTLPRGLRPYGGGAWPALSADAVREVARVLREEPDVVRFFRFAKIPDELFFQTVLMNSPLADTVVDESLHHLDWSAGSAHPATFGTADLPALAASGRLFARKFDTHVDAQVLDRIDAELLRVRV